MKTDNKEKIIQHKKAVKQTLRNFSKLLFNAMSNHRNYHSTLLKNATMVFIK